MKYRLEVRGSAERDVAAATDWYEAQELGLGSLFLDDFAQVLGRLSESPLIYQVVYRESRRAQLHRFPYLVWFKVQNELVTVRACLRGSINPPRFVGVCGKSLNAAQQGAPADKIPYASLRAFCA